MVWDFSHIDMKFNIYPQGIIPLILLLVALVFGAKVVMLSSRTPAPDPYPLPVAVPPISSMTAEEMELEPPPMSVTSLPNSLSNPKFSPQPTPAAPLPPEKFTGPAGEGLLRVSNRSDHPVRIAVLARSLADAAPTNPVHWDFAPEEGSGKGLLLSLPTVDLNLKPGDIVVAFSLDGSRRYWGPYIAGETSFPLWNAETSEWQLILQP